MYLRPTSYNDMAARLENIARSTRFNVTRVRAVVA